MNRDERRQRPSRRDLHDLGGIEFYRCFSSNLPQLKYTLLGGRYLHSDHSDQHPERTERRQPAGEEYPPLQLSGKSLLPWWAEPSPSATIPHLDRPFLCLAAAECGAYEFGLDYHWFGPQSLTLLLMRNGSLPRFY
jgi:hypothetical protein